MGNLLLMCKFFNLVAHRIILRLYVWNVKWFFKEKYTGISLPVCCQQKEENVICK